MYAYNLHFQSSKLGKVFFEYLLSLPGTSDDAQVSEEALRRAERAGIPFQRPSGCMSCICCSPDTRWARNDAVDSTRLEQMTIYPIPPRHEHG